MDKHAPVSYTHLALGDQLKSENNGVSLFTYPVKGYFDSVLYALLNQAGGDEFYGKDVYKRQIMKNVFMPLPAVCCSLTITRCGFWPMPLKARMKLMLNAQNALRKERKNGLQEKTLIRQFAVLRLP